MQGTMLWFNRDKGYGFIRTEEDERLYVAESGFAADQSPGPRCKGRVVSFERAVGGGDPCAVNVSFVEQLDGRRARLRSSHGGRRL
jgi:cold shock CspA family protein